MVRGRRGFLGQRRSGHVFYAILFEIVALHVFISNASISDVSKDDETTE